MSESKHLDDLVARALAAIARDGKAALDAICAEYPDDAEKLRGRLERLLRHDLAQEFVSTEAGTVLRSRFLIEDTVGEGGMGRVLLARDLELDRQVALKRLRALADQNTSMRFERELRVVAKLRHPHIAQLHEVQEIDGGLVAVLEYVPGCDLAQLLDAVRSRSGDHLPEGPELASAWRQAAGQEPDPAVVRGGYLQFAIQCALQAAEAVQFAHQHDVVHRDIKPSNLLIESSGVVRLCDFGLAAFDDGLSVSNEQTFLGTAAYAAPEQLSGQPATQAMDIYALGATFYELVTLAQPFAATTTAELFRKVQADAPRAPRAIQAQIPRDVEAVCLKALAKRPQDRYATVAELAADLRALRDRRPVVARRPSVVARAGASMRRHAGTWAAGSVVTVAVAMGGYFQTRAAGLEREAAEQVDLLRAQLEVAMGELEAAVRLPEGSGSRPDYMQPEVGGRFSHAQSLSVQFAEALQRVTPDVAALADRDEWRQRLQDVGRARAIMLATDRLLFSGLIPVHSDPARNRYFEAGIVRLVQQHVFDVEAYWAHELSLDQATRAISGTGLRDPIVGLLLQLRTTLRLNRRPGPASMLTPILVKLSEDRKEQCRFDDVNRGNAQAAMQALRRINIESCHPIEAYAWIRALRAIGDPVFARALLSRAMRTHRTDLYLNMLSAQWFDPVVARDRYETLKGFFPNRESPWAMHAIRSLEAARDGSLEKKTALLAVEDFVKQFEDSALAYHLLAEAHELLGDDDACDRALARAVESNPPLVEALAKRAFRLPASHRNEKIELYRRALAVDPWFQMARENLGFLLTARRGPGDLDSALEVLREAVRQNEDVNLAPRRSPRLHFLLAEAAEASEQWGAAARHFLVAAELEADPKLDGDLSHALARAARCARRAGREALARELAWRVRCREADGMEGQLKEAWREELQQLAQPIQDAVQNPGTNPTSAAIGVAWQASERGKATAADDAWSQVAIGSLSVAGLLYRLSAALESGRATTPEASLQRAGQMLKDAVERLRGMQETKPGPEVYWAARLLLSASPGLNRFRDRYYRGEATELERSALFPGLKALVAIRKGSSMF